MRGGSEQQRIALRADHSPDAGAPYDAVCLVQTRPPALRATPRAAAATDATVNPIEASKLRAKDKSYYYWCASARGPQGGGSAPG